MAKGKKGKRKKFKNLSRVERFDEDLIDRRQILDTESLSDRHSRWRERVNEDEPEPEYSPEDFAGQPLGTVLNMRSGHHYVRISQHDEPSRIADRVRTGRTGRHDGVVWSLQLVADGHLARGQIDQSARNKERADAARAALLK